MPTLLLHTPPARPAPVERIADDRNNISPGDEVLLVVEDDPSYASIVASLAREGGLKVLVAMTGAEALDWIRQRKQFPQGDFARMRHQQEFLRALMDKAASTGTLSWTVAAVVAFSPGRALYQIT